MPAGHLYIIIGEMSIQVFWPFFFFFFFFALELYKLYILEIKLLSVALFELFSHIPLFVFLVFFFFNGFLCCAKACQLIRSHWFIFAFISVALGDWPKKIFVWFIPECVLPLFSSWSLMVCGLIFKSLSHFGFIFVHDVMVCPSFIDIHVAV